MRQTGQTHLLGIMTKGDDSLAMVGVEDGTFQVLTDKSRRTVLNIHRLTALQWLCSFLSAISFWFFPQPVLAAPHPYVQVSTFTYSEPVSIHTALNDWQGRFYGGREQFSTNWFEAGLRQGLWGIGYLYRNDYLLRFSSDTAEFYYRMQNDRPTDERSYRLSLEASHFTATGVRAEHRYLYPEYGAMLKIGISAFVADDLTDGWLNGSESRAQIDYRYSEDALFGRTVEPPSGKGLAVDLAVRWQPHSDWIVEGRAVDLPGLIRWSHAPRTIATADADRESRNEQGVVTLDPLVSGLETTERHWWQTLEPRISLTSQWQFRQVYSLLFGYHRINDADRWNAGFAQQFRWGTGAARYWPGLNMVAINAQSDGWAVKLGFDSLDKLTSSALRLSLSVEY